MWPTTYLHVCILIDCKISENIYEEDEDFLERSEDLTFYEDFFLMSFSFVNFGLQQKVRKFLKFQFYSCWTF